MVAEVAGGPARRVDLDDVPSEGTGLLGECGGEGVDGLGVLDVAEELSGPRAGDVAPGERLNGIDVRRAPALPGRADGCTVRACVRGQGPVGCGETPPSVDGGAQGEPQACQPPDDLGEPGALQPHDAAEVCGRNPWPVGDESERALLAGFEQDGQQPVRAGITLDAAWERSPRQRLLGRPRPRRAGAAERGAQTEEDCPRRCAPDGRLGPCGSGVALEGEIGDERGISEQPARLSERPPRRA